MRVLNFKSTATFFKNTDGQIAIMMALLLVPLGIIIGGAVDWVVNINQSSKQQQAMDTALLAAVSVTIDEVKYPSETSKKQFREKTFLDIYKVNYAQTLPEFTFTFTSKGMQASSKDETKTTLLNLANIKKLDINISASAIFPKQVTFEIVLVFDATGSMSRIINSVKTNATNFTDDILTELNSEGIKLDNIDTKVISYKDYWVDSDAMYRSRFYHLPAEKTQFSAIIRPIRASGGGDLPESGLEALVYAVRAKSPSRKPDAVANKIIVLWTDAEAIPLENQRVSAVNNRLVTTASRWSPWYRRSTNRYPSNMPKNLTRMKKIWDENKNTKLLLFYGKNGQGANFYPWKQMKNWNGIKHIIGNPNNINYDDLIEEIATTISEMSSTRLSK